jgi:hypothetical protein
MPPASPNQKDLHRQAAKAWNLPQSEILHRNWLFWVICCCEKAMAPAQWPLSDDNISCTIPTAIVSDSTIDIEIFTESYSPRENLPCDLQTRRFRLCFQTYPA